jgi:UDP-N-acetyl-D-mannosaminuronic acid dehydrogenase
VEFSKICVLGMGYIGLPTASTLATHGYDVVGVDVNQQVIESLRNGEIHIQEPGLKTLVHAAFRSGNLEVLEKPQEADAFIIAVPTPILEDKTADMRYVISATESIVPYLRKGNLVMLESTSPPRTTLDLVAPILETSGLHPGVDFYLTYSPERVMPGRILQELIENARVVGGINHASAEAGRDLYATFVRGEILLADATTAEMVKLMENTYRDVNIAIANEFARLAERFGVNVWEAIELANLHPRIDILRAGPGVGGHCISVDPWFFVDKAPDLALLIKQARLVNDGQPLFTVEWISKWMGDLKGQKIAALGLTYKADVDDLRQSPAIEVAKILAEKGAQVSSFEPFVPNATASNCTAKESLEETLEDADAIVLLVDHHQFLQIKPSWAANIMPGRVVFDTRGVWDRNAWEAAGFQLHVLGVGERRD